MSSDALVFDADERGPSDDLRLQSEATNQLDDEGKALVKALIEGVLLRHEARRWTTNASRTRQGARRLRTHPSKIKNAPHRYRDGLPPLLIPEPP